MSDAFWGYEVRHRTSRGSLERGWKACLFAIHRYDDCDPPPSAKGRDVRRSLDLVISYLGLVHMLVSSMHNMSPSPIELLIRSNIEDILKLPAQKARVPEPRQDLAVGSKNKGRELIDSYLPVWEMFQYLRAD